MRIVDQLLLAGSVVPVVAMVLLLWASFRVPRDEPRAERLRSLRDGR